VTAPTKQRILQEFIRVHEIDILLVQEVTQIILQDLLGYNTHYNIGTARRGTAIFTREGIRLENIIQLLSDCAIGARFCDT
jgi:hypothetical protein